MIEQVFDNLFHKRYVGGDGIVLEKPVVMTVQSEVSGMSYEKVLEHYRKYVGDPEAELPEEVMEELIRSGKI